MKFLTVLSLVLFSSFFTANAESGIYDVQNNALLLPGTIQFNAHAYDVKNTNDPMLDFVAQYMKDRPYITKLRIEGHVFSEKSPAENVKLSLQRAAMISYYLTTKGIDCSRLLPVAFGDTKPIAPTDECNLSFNTRIDFFNAEVNHKAVQGNAVDGFAVKVFEPCDQ